MFDHTQFVPFTASLSLQQSNFDPDYKLVHVLSATKRQIAWLKELRQDEETPIYDRSIKVYSAIPNLLEPVVRI